MTHLCAHFGSAKGCRYGSKCHFSHDNPSSIPVCKRFLSNKCRYGTTCKFRHIKKELEAQSTSAASAKSSTRKPNPHSFIDLKHLDVYLRYEGRCSSMNTNEHIGAHTLYRYYDKNNKDRNSRRATHLLEFHTNKNRVHLEYQTDIATQHKNVSLYSCGLLHANKYIFIHQSGIIYKCCCVKRAGANDIFACKTVDHIQLADYKNNIELIKTSATCDTQYYTIHELCICNEKPDYIMCYSFEAKPSCSSTSALARMRVPSVKSLTTKYMSFYGLQYSIFKFGARSQGPRRCHAGIVCQLPNVFDFLFILLLYLAAA
eukprot:941127_1